MNQQSTYSSAGDQNLHVLDESTRFTDWMYETIQPYVVGNILEIGSGHGTYSEKLIRDYSNRHIVLSDIDEQYVTALEERFCSPNVMVHRVDISSSEDFTKIRTPIDTVIALNVLEHIKDDTLALSNIAGMLYPGGRCILLVPAHPQLFNIIDRGLGHHRRYTRRMLLECAARAGLTPQRMFAFNAAAIAGWYWNGTILGRDVIHSSALRCYDACVPIFRWIERHIFRQCLGVSIVAVFERRET